MRHALAIMLMTVAGCATIPINPEREIYKHGLSSIRRAEGSADDTATAAAEADILRAFMKLKANLKENSSDTAGRRKDMTDALRGQQMPYFSPKELGDIIEGLIDTTAAASSRRLLDFRRSIADRDNPDGFDPVRRAILDRELSRRGIIAQAGR